MLELHVCHCLFTNSASISHTLPFQTVYMDYFNPCCVYATSHLVHQVSGKKEDTFKKILDCMNCLSVTINHGLTSANQINEPHHLAAEENSN